MDQSSDGYNDGRSASRDGLAAVAVVFLTIALIVYVVSSLV